MVGRCFASMLNAAALTANLSGLVGWHPLDGNPTGPLHLSTSLTTAKAGLYVNDLNELLTLSVLADVVPEEETLDAWLQRLTTDALTRLTARLASAHGLDGKVLLSNQNLLPGPGHATDTINKLSRFVGLRLSLAPKRGVTVTIPRLTIQLDTVQATPLPIYVYSSDSPEPIKVVTLPAGFNKANYPYRYELEGSNAVDISFAAEPGVWAYIGYYEDDLTGRAINREGAGASCGCTADPFPLYRDFVSVSGVAVGSQNLGSGALRYFLPEYAYLETSNFGLDLFLSGYCDTSTAFASKADELTANQLQIAPVVQLALGIRLLEALVSSPNITQVVQRQAVQADAYALLTLYRAQLYGGKDQSTQNDYYPSMLEKVSLDLSGLDSACLPQKESLLSMGSLGRG
jgi:hypothetical protein